MPAKSKTKKAKNLALEMKELKKKIALQKRELAILTNIIDQLPGSIYWKNKSGVYLGRNTTSAVSMRRMGFKWLKKEIIGQTDYQLFSKEIADGFRKNDLLVMKTKEEHQSEERTVLPSGEEVVQVSIKRPLFDEKNRTIGVVGNTVDITYLKRIEAELMKAKEEAEAAIQAKDEFIKNVEHDIRTPFSGISVLASILEASEEDPQRKEYLGDISSCAKELQEYCNSILEFAKAEAGITPILAKKMDPRMLVNKIISMETPAAKNKKLQLLTDIDDSVPAVVIGDPQRIQRILINLVSNAIKFTETGFVKIRMMTKKRIPKQSKVILQIIIEDTGVGIPKEKQDYIYEKFSRLTPASQGVYKGSGLGMRVVKQLMGEIEGELDLKSEVNKGTVFTCTIPFDLPLIEELVVDE